MRRDTPSTLRPAAAAAPDQAADTMRRAGAVVRSEGAMPPMRGDLPAVSRGAVAH